jgi:hypothetical protein
VNWFNLLASVRSAPLSCEYGIESILAPHTILGVVWVLANVD